MTRKLEDGCILSSKAKILVIIPIALSICLKNYSWKNKIKKNWLVHQNNGKNHNAYLNMFLT